ncbi:MAG: hypothetical protein HY520_04355 [Candidatus Aenigmarchaeota archaeon]|nr:hypothetical protein [Candidatus Aenigmarchaeota archaeon]
MIALLAIQKGRTVLVTLAATALMLVIYPLLQSLGQADIWFAVIAPGNLALYLAFSILFGLMTSLQVHRLRARACPVRKSGSLGLAGTVGGFFVAQCPTCAVLLATFLPFNTIILISSLNVWLTLGSMALMLLAIHLLGGFRPAAQGTPKKGD